MDRADVWQKEQEQLDKLIENRFGKKLGDFKLNWMNENQGVRNVNG